MDADVRDQREVEISSGEPKRHRRTADDGDYMPPAAAAAAVADSDSAGSYRRGYQHSNNPLEQPLPSSLRMQQHASEQQAAYGTDLNRQFIDLHHASSYASSLVNPSAQNFAAVMAAAAAANAAAAATETTGTSREDVSEEERVRRRREINRNSQKRIRERRNKELDGLKYEAQRLQVDNESLLRQVEGLTLEKADMLRQIQDLTEKWQQSIAENAWLNRENIQLRNSLQQLNSLVTGAGPPPPAAAAAPALAVAGGGSMAAAAAAALAAAAVGGRGSSASGGGDPHDGLGGMGLPAVNATHLAAAMHHAIDSNIND